MKRVLGAAFAVAFAVSAISAPAMAGNGYGKQIKDECGLSYGQLVSIARKSGHVTGPVRGAKYFVKSGLLAAHIAAGACPNSPAD